jgi:hypothetical protein
VEPALIQACGERVAEISFTCGFYWLFLIEKAIRALSAGGATTAHGIAVGKQKRRTAP